MNKTVRNVFIGSLLVGAGIKTITVIKKKNKKMELVNTNDVKVKKKRIDIHDLVDRRKYTCIANVDVKEKND